MKKEQKIITKFFILNNFSNKDIFNMISKTYKEESVCYSTIKNWVKGFKEGNLNIEDKEKSGRPIEI